MNVAAPYVRITMLALLSFCPQSLAHAPWPRAKSLGYRELPLPKNLHPAQEFDVPATPTHGFFRYLEPT